MITELKSIPDIWKRMPSEMHARRFLENIIWSTGRHCPHCGSVVSSPLRGTKLDLRFWVSAMFLVLTSSKGISSVVLARLLGVNQKTAWKMGHAIREMMDDRNGELLPLEDIVEVDEA